MVDTNLSSKLELFVSCKDLVNKDTFSKSDPMCVLWMKDQKSAQWRMIGQTETVMNDLNPRFKTSFLVDYFFEELQELRFQIYDRDSSSQDFHQHDHLGELVITVAELVATPGGVVDKPLHKENYQQMRSRSRIRIKCEEVSKVLERLTVTLIGSKLDKKDFFGSSDPYVQFHRWMADAKEPFVLAHQTETIMNNLNPQFKPFSITAQTLCNGDYDRPILVKCFDYDRDSSHDTIGEFQFTLRELFAARSGPKPNQYSLTKTLIHPRKQKEKSGYKGSGNLTINVEYVREYSFLEYVAGGMSTSLMVAIDFTGSNGDPADADSLHFRRGQQPNQYQKALRVIGDIIAPYDADQMFPAWGFGARLPNGEVSHCFPLTFQPDRPEVKGVDGLLEVYQKSLDKVVLSGPTYFGKIIQAATAIASAPFAPGKQHYFILLIITDGVINDMNQTIQAIIEASKRPLSIIIVGVGNADFSQMEALDADKQRLQFNNVFASRDIVQFVPFSRFANMHISQLAKETLAEVPNQVTEFMRMYSIPPMPRRQVQQQLSFIPGPEAPSAGPAAQGPPAPHGPNLALPTGSAPPPPARPDALVAGVAQISLQDPSNLYAAPQQQAGYQAPAGAGGPPVYVSPPPAPQQNPYGDLPPPPAYE